jgi:hypothetical protein
MSEVKNVKNVKPLTGEDAGGSAAQELQSRKKRSDGPSARKSMNVEGKRTCQQGHTKHVCRLVRRLGKQLRMQTNQDRGGSERLVEKSSKEM